MYSSSECITITIQSFSFTQNIAQIFTLSHQGTIYNIESPKIVKIQS